MIFIELGYVDTRYISRIYIKFQRLINIKLNNYFSLTIRQFFRNIYILLAKKVLAPVTIINKSN